MSLLNAEEREHVRRLVSEADSGAMGVKQRLDLIDSMYSRAFARRLRKITKIIEDLKEVTP